MLALAHELVIAGGHDADAHGCQMEIEAYCGDPPPVTTFDPLPIVEPGPAARLLSNHDDLAGPVRPRRHLRR